MGVSRVTVDVQRRKIISGKRKMGNSKTEKDSQDSENLRGKLVFLIYSRRHNNQCMCVRTRAVIREQQALCLLKRAKQGQSLQNKRKWERENSETKLRVSLGGFEENG